MRCRLSVQRSQTQTQRSRSRASVVPEVRACTGSTESRHAFCQLPRVSMRSCRQNRKFSPSGHSPDPDDAFMFYAMAENKIDLRGYRFEHRLEDIQTLNERATARRTAHFRDLDPRLCLRERRYALLPCGASMGDGYGPMVVAAGKPQTWPSMPPTKKSAPGSELATIAIPGRMTSAYLALATLSGRLRSHRRAVRPNLRSGEKRASRRRA